MDSTACEDRAIFEWAIPYIDEASITRIYKFWTKTVGRQVCEPLRSVCSVKLTRHSHIWLFEGAEGGKWLSDLEAAHAQAVQTSDPPPNAQSSSSAPMTVVDAPRDAKRARVYDVT